MRGTNSFESHAVENGSGFQTVWIGDTREGDGAWKTERGAPAMPVPTYSVGIEATFEPNPLSPTGRSFHWHWRILSILSKPSERSIRNTNTRNSP